MVDGFVAFDLETLNDDPTSICEIAFVKFDELRDDSDYPSIHSLVRPSGELHVSFRAFEVHGIEPEDLIGAPQLADIWHEIEVFLGDLPLVAHGATNDINKLLKTLSQAGVTPRQRVYYCTLVTARNKPDVLSNLPFSVQNLASMADRIVQNTNDLALKVPRRPSRLGVLVHSLRNGKPSIRR